nr:MAG TPA: hypothetical protein [Caudoviricetes sp.]
MPLNASIQPSYFLNVTHNRLEGFKSRPDVTLM